MGLEEQQAALAKIYTSHSLREQLVKLALKEDFYLGLCRSEQTKLYSIVNTDIKIFALSLLRKRLEQIKKILPGTCALLAENLSSLFQTFAADKPTTGVKRHLIDASNFANYLAQKKPNQIFRLDEQKAVLEYEKTWVNSELSAMLLKVKFFKHDISNYTKQLEMQEPNRAYFGKPRVCIWFRLSRSHRVLYWELFPRFWLK